jgi:hypothetical protein
MIFKSSGRASERTPNFTITKINWLTQFMKRIAVYTENHTRNIIEKNPALLIVKSEGTYIYLGFIGVTVGGLIFQYYVL